MNHLLDGGIEIKTTNDLMEGLKSKFTRRLVVITKFVWFGVGVALWKRLGSNTDPLNKNTTTIDSK